MTKAEWVEQVLSEHAQYKQRGTRTQNRHRHSPLATQIGTSGALPPSRRFVIPESPPCASFGGTRCWRTYCGRRGGPACSLLPFAEGTVTTTVVETCAMGATSRAYEWWAWNEGCGWDPFESDRLGGGQASISSVTCCDSTTPR